MQNLELLIKELIKLPNETETVEFKHNNFDPEMIGSDISALANSAANRGKNQSYMVWGVNNETHDIVGTNYNRFSKLAKNQEIDSWLKNTISKNADFDFFDAEIIVGIGRDATACVTICANPSNARFFETKPTQNIHFAFIARS